MPHKPNFTDGELVKLWREGDAEAFEGLVYRYKEAAYRWALDVCRDAHAAEDAVQEAVCQLYESLSGLREPDRFVYWFRRIVRSKALMALRRQKARAERLTDDPESIGKARDERPSALIHESGDEAALPELLDALSDRERDVIDAYYFQNMPPSEISGRYDMSADGIYQMLSRSRLKMKARKQVQDIKEYIRENVDVRYADRASVPMDDKRLRQAWKSSRHSFACAVWSILPAAGIGTFDLTDVMGLTGQAFRLTVETERIGKAGAFMYYWEPVFEEGLANLGLDCVMIGDGGAEPSPYMLARGVNHIRASVAGGQPLIGWGIGGAGFGVICGYDDREQLLTAADGKGPRTIRYEELGGGRNDGLFILSIQKSNRLPDPHQTVIRSLRMAVRHARTEKTFIGCAAGLPAYESWKEAVRRGTAEPSGSMYCAELTADARKFASAYLAGLSAAYSVNPQVQELFRSAADLYGQVSELLAGGTEADGCNEWLERLGTASRLEAAAVERLAELAARLPTLTKGVIQWNNKHLERNNAAQAQSKH